MRKAAPKAATTGNKKCQRGRVAEAEFRHKRQTARKIKATSKITTRGAVAPARNINNREKNTAGPLRAPHSIRAKPIQARAAAGASGRRPLSRNVAKVSGTSQPIQFGAPLRYRIAMTAAAI